MIIDDYNVEFEIGLLGQRALNGVENCLFPIANRYYDAGFYRKRLDGFWQFGDDGFNPSGAKVTTFVTQGQ